MKHHKKYYVWGTVLVLLSLVAADAPFSTGTSLASDKAAANPPVPVLVAYYSRTGHTEKMAQGVVKGVQRVPGVVAQVKAVSEVTKADLERAHGIVLGSPTYFANIPGAMKTVIDDWNWKLKVDFTDKVGGAFATAGGYTGGQGHVVTSLLLFMLNNRMIVAGPLYRNPQTGSIWGEPGTTAVTGPADSGVSDSELEGAQKLGERVARLAVKMSAVPAG